MEEGPVMVWKEGPVIMQNKNGAVNTVKEMI